MKLKEFLSLFRTMPGGVSSLNNEDSKKAAKIRTRLDRTSASSDEGELCSNRADMTLDDGGGCRSWHAGRRSG